MTAGVNSDEQSTCDLTLRERAISII